MSDKDSKVNVGSNVRIERFEITDEKVVQAFKSVLADGGSAEKYLTDIIAVGSQIVGIANAGAGVEKLSEGIASTERALENATQKVKEDLIQSIDNVTGEKSPLAAKLAVLVEDFARELEGLTVNEESPIRQGIKRQISDMSTQLFDDFARQQKSAREDILSKLNPEAEGSPFAIFGHEITELKNGIGALATALTANKAKELEAKKGTDKGRTFERRVMDVVTVIASGSGDDAEHTGDITGLTGKMGDGVVTVRAGLKRAARLVIEAKDKKLTEAKWHSEASGSMKNREAIGFLGVCKNLEDMPNKQRLFALDNLGLQLVVNFDPDEPGDHDFLALVFQVVKMHTLSSVRSGDQMNLQAMSLYVEQALKQLQRLSKFATYAKNIKREADNILRDQEDLNDDLNGYLKSIRREIMGVDTMTLIETSSAQALEGSNEDYEE